MLKLTMQSKYDYTDLGQKQIRRYQIMRHFL